MSLLKIILTVLIKYYKIYFFSKKIDLIKSKIKNDKYLRYFFPLLEDDWNNSFKGITAVENLIFIYVSKFFFSKNNIKKNFYYICENQGWEKIFVKSFKIFNVLKMSSDSSRLLISDFPIDMEDIINAL